MARMIYIHTHLCTEIYSIVPSCHIGHPQLFHRRRYIVFLTERQACVEVEDERGDFYAAGSDVVAPKHSGCGGPVVATGGRKMGPRWPLLDFLIGYAFNKWAANVPYSSSFQQRGEAEMFKACWVLPTLWCFSNKTDIF